MFHEVTIGHGHLLTWCDIQECNMWCNDLSLLYKTRFHDAKMYGKPEGPYVVTFMFYEAKHAMLFKLRWGGRHGF